MGVEYLSLPTKLQGITIGEADDDDVRTIEKAVSRAVSKDRIFVLQSGGGRYLILAAAMKVFENDLDMFESSLEKF